MITSSKPSIAVVPQYRNGTPCPDQKYAVDVYPAVIEICRESNTFERVSFDDVIGNCSTMVNSDVPMFDSQRFTALLHVGKCRNITYHQHTLPETLITGCVNVLHTFDT